MINTKRACLRFYGTEKLALYKAHMHKDKEGLDNDNILKLLPPTTTVMHDHNKVNYNEDYSFANAECNQQNGS
jgi:transposase